MKGMIWLGLMIVLMLACPAYGASQSQFELVGVAQDLSLLGVAEVWTDEGSGGQHCAVRIYEKNQWQPGQAKTVISEGLDEKGFEQACEALQEKARKKFKLHTIKWEMVGLIPAAPSVKDASGKIIEAPNFWENYPALQQAVFELSDKSMWQLVVRSQKQAHQPQAYVVVLRNPDEPAPYRSIPGVYDTDSLLLTPVRVMASNYYGLVTLVFRETRQGSNGLAYTYRPYFMRWPAYSPISQQEAIDTLIEASDYAMEPDELLQGPNSGHIAYRAYLRLKTQPVPYDDLKGYLDRSSPAGKLYWLALLHEAYPQSYAGLAQSVLEESSKSMDVIEVTGRQWQTVPFEAKLKDQMQAFSLPK